jgi:hypothetical protein
MKTRALLAATVLALFFANTSTAQTYMRTHGTSAKDVYTHGLAVFDDGSSIVTGQAFGSGAGEATLMKLDPAGNLLWRTATLSTFGSVRIFTDAEILANGDVLAVGQYDSKPVIARFNGSTGALIFHRLPLDFSYDGLFRQIEPTADGQFVAGGYVSDERQTSCSASSMNSAA